MNDGIKVVIVTQARYGSSRLPGKILKKINGETLLGIHLQRLRKSKFGKNVVVATTHEKDSESISQIALKMGCTCFKGDMDDVLDRFYQSVKDLEVDYVVRVTSDCPLIDPVLIDLVVEKCLEENADYASCVLSPTFPDGFDCEVFTFSALEKAWNEANLKSDREHVTPYIWRNSLHHGGKMFKSFSYENDLNYSNLRLTVDDEKDFMLIHEVVCEKGSDLGWKDYVDYLLQNPHLVSLNSDTLRNEGYLKSISEDC